MWPAIAAAAGSAAGPLVGAWLGDRRAKEQQNQAQGYIDDAISEYERLNLPTYDTNMPLAPNLEEIGPVSFDEYSLAGEYNPEFENLVSQGATEFTNIEVDPRLKNAQMAALDSLAEIGEGGQTAEDKARLAEMQMNLSAQERGSREAIMQNARARGLGGSGMEMVANLSNSQNASNRARLEGLKINSDAEKRALDAIIAGGNMSGQVRGQDFSEQAARAQAQDAINRFNAANSQGLQTRNVNRTNEGSQLNLNARQDIMNRNTGVRNQGKEFNTGLLQYNNDTRQKNYANQREQIDYRNQMKDRSFGNAMDVIGGKNAVRQVGAGAAEGAAQGTRQMYAGLGQGISQGVNAGMTYYGGEKDRDLYRQRYGLPEEE